MKLRSASCQLAYWQGGSLRIVNYLTRRVFSANPIALEVIRFFFTPRTIEDSLLQFRAYSRKSVAETVLKLIEAQLVFEVVSPECQQDNLAQSHWKPWLPEGGFHFMTKDARYVGGDWTVEQKMKALPKTPPPPQFKALNNGHSIALPRHEVESDTFFNALHARRTHRQFAQGRGGADRKRLVELSRRFHAGLSKRQTGL